jgi:hypothetical protein
MPLRNQALFRAGARCGVANSDAPSRSERERTWTDVDEGNYASSPMSRSVRRLIGATMLYRPDRK